MFVKYKGTVNSVTQLFCLGKDNIKKMKNNNSN